MEMRDRLPAYFSRALKLHRQKDVVPAQLHSVVAAMTMSYHLNYELIFPPINHTLILVQYVHDLALPSRSWASFQDSVTYHT
jgi:RNA polymerase I-specific transcription initiation factor RRN7